MEHPHEHPRKLYRSETNKTFAGVCGGLGEYFDVDPVGIRLIWIILIIFSGFFPGLLAYLFAILIIPKKPIAPHVQS
jgi:phage shock protein C